MLIRQLVQQVSQMVWNPAILSYVGAPTGDPTSMKQAGTLLNKANLTPLLNPGEPDGANKSYNLLIGRNSITWQFSINDVSFLPPSAPVHLQKLSGTTNAAANKVLTGPNTKDSTDAESVSMINGIGSRMEMVLGFFKIMPELMGLGYATGKAVQPDHTGKSLPIFSAKLVNIASCRTGLHPPLDHMSGITFWWGLEIPMLEPTMRYLYNAKSILQTLINVLTALSALDTGVCEILPFIRYISQCINFGWGVIKN